MNKSVFPLILLILIFIVGCTRIKKEYWNNGTKKSEIHTKDDSYEGKATWWYEDGKKQLECFYKDNLLDSIMTRWYNTGIKQEEAHYKKNKLEGTTVIWDRKGNLASKGIYKDGELNGLYVEWYGDIGFTTIIRVVLLARLFLTMETGNKKPITITVS